MNAIPVIAFSGFSGTGKTTFIEKLIPFLKAKGLRLAVLKHDAHEFDIDHVGKDSWRFTHAGADNVYIHSASKAAAVLQGNYTAQQIISSISNVDLILMEGNKYTEYPRVGLSRKATGKGLTDAPARFIAIITDDETVQAPCPVFGLENVEAFGNFLLEYIGRDMGVPNEKDFTHFGDDGRARMVNVGDKQQTQRKAVAAVSVLVSPATFALIRSGGMKKGDVLTVAQIAGIMGAKQTPSLIPMCHTILLSGVDLKLRLNEERCSVEIEAAVESVGKTGVEMEALTAASTAALTVYDMCKAVQKDIVIDNLRLLKKTGGIHGDYHRKD